MATVQDVLFLYFAPKISMTISCMVLTGSMLTVTISAFSPPFNTIHTKTNIIPIIKRTSPLSASLGFDGNNMGRSANTQGTIDLTNEFAQRDVYGMEHWALQNGVQKVNGVELASADNGGGMDYQLITNQNIAGGNPVMFVPAAMVLSSNTIADELGGNLEAAENALVQEEVLTARRLPLFRLMVKILSEYEQGEQSPYFPWLNSLPRRFYNGVAMTGECLKKNK